MKQFIPLTDELMFDHPELLTAPCVPFSLDYDCYRWLDATASGTAPNEEKPHE